MDMTNHDAISTIAESIVAASREIMSKSSYDVTFASTVIADQDTSGNYGIMYKGNETHIPNYSGKEISINTKVFVTLPGNDYKTMYISTVMDDSVAGGGSSEGGTSDYTALVNKPRINGITLTGNKTASELGIAPPTRTSQLTNDSGFITAQDIPDIPPSVEVPTKLSELTNDVGFITADAIPTIPTVPTKVSELTNDAGYITAADIPSSSTAIAENVSYDNSSSGLTATNVQAAIDEIAASGGGGSTPIVIGDDYVSKDEFAEFVDILVDKLVED